MYCARSLESASIASSSKTAGSVINVIQPAALFVLRGVPFTRTRNLDGLVTPYQNEVCVIYEVDQDDPRPVNEQALVQCTANDIKATPTPRILHRTNKPFPECRFDPASYPTRESREHTAPLTCRWILTLLYPDKRFRRAQRPVSGETLEHITEKDVSRLRNQMSDSKKLLDWRKGEYSRGGSHKAPYGRAAKMPQAGLNHARDWADPVLLRPRCGRQTYTAADIFSGAGGYSAGAKMAGIHIVHAVDHWPRCNATYRANHSDHDMVDLVHLSPPCQTWSPAHTANGKHDDANIAALYASQFIVEKLRPRFITFEQTFGIIQERYRFFFNAFVQSLTRHGYSTRKRLIMIAAAPGQCLPSWPAPVHSASPKAGQKPLVSAIRACVGLREDEDLHDVAAARAIENRLPWNGHLPMNRTITTSGGQAYHWEGKREFTLAEFARLQGFPHNYQFVKPCVKKQIGNAFPPIVVFHLTKHLKHWMERLDRVEPEMGRAHLDAISVSSSEEHAAASSPQRLGYRAQLDSEEARRRSSGSSLMFIGVQSVVAVTEQKDEDDDEGVEKEPQNPFKAIPGRGPVALFNDWLLSRIQDVRQGSTGVVERASNSGSHSTMSADLADRSSIDEPTGEEGEDQQQTARKRALENPLSILNSTSSTKRRRSDEQVIGQ
ncbi:S-adenosyl-L-methionine-dependent methyltransferase [Coniella lustricola]|uniref:DNA (cytosine-5-)-methyltransferase n=1 Tax=Coniella lustricola TaxID=2025994 RepID=A0A2T3ALR9_9PEZI|nr:S-adenosyl-L-methionine-dependent methyltransferase [Coniella lustricola]